MFEGNVMQNSAKKKARIAIWLRDTDLKMLVNYVIQTKAANNQVRWTCAAPT